MKNTEYRLDNFENEKLSKSQQKIVRGGEDEIDPNEPGKKTGTGNG